MDRILWIFRNKKEQNHIDGSNHTPGHMEKKSIAKVRATLGHSNLRDARQVAGMNPEEIVSGIDW